MNGDEFSRQKEEHMQKSRNKLTLEVSKTDTHSLSSNTCEDSMEDPFSLELKRSLSAEKPYCCPKKIK